MRDGFAGAPSTTIFDRESRQVRRWRARERNFGGRFRWRTPATNGARNRLLLLLRQGERMLWVGRPDRRVRFVAADVSLSPVARPRRLLLHCWALHLQKASSTSQGHGMTELYHDGEGRSVGFRERADWAALVASSGGGRRRTSLRGTDAQSWIVNGRCSQYRRHAPSATARRKLAASPMSRADHRMVASSPLQR